MKLTTTTFLLFFIFTVSGQTTLNKIGQTPGGSGFHVNYDSSSQRLFVGCGGSVRMYDASDPDTLIMIGHRPFFSLINETYVDGNTLFVAANHDGFWALDISEPEMPILGHYPTGGDSAAFDIDMYNDTLYFANTRKAIDELEAKGYPFIPDKRGEIARPFRDCEFAFIHPKKVNGVLLELIDYKWDELEK
jgi:hypothetical protein